jgi:hypothetical protein
MEVIHVGPPDVQRSSGGPVGESGALTPWHAKADQVLSSCLGAELILRTDGGAMSSLVAHERSEENAIHDK